MRLAILVSALILVCFQALPQPFDLDASVKRGLTLYQINCQSCHMLNGEGLARVFPPLVKSQNIEDKDRMIKVTLLGMKGTLTVNGIVYNGTMNRYPLSDQEVSDVLNYIRNSWGNRMEPILPSEIQPGLKTRTDNYQPY